jgi:hypothetical protein
MRSGVGVERVKLELQNLVEKHREPLAKLKAEGIKERVARAPANRWQVGSAQKQSRVGCDGEEQKWSGKRRKEALAPRRSGVGDKTTGIHGQWPPAVHCHYHVTARGVVCPRVTSVAS